MNLADNHHRNLPVYYSYMYLDGYSPTQIFLAHRKRNIENFKEENEITNLKITSEVKIR